jgi:hypothetical protein
MEIESSDSDDEICEDVKNNIEVEISVEKIPH